MEAVQRGRAALSLHVLGNKFVDGRLIRSLRENWCAERGDDERNYETKMHNRFRVRYETVKCHRYSNEVETLALLEAKARSERAGEIESSNRAYHSVRKA